MENKVTGYKKYIKDVQSEQRIAGKYERLAVARFLSDLDKSKSADYLYYFDETRAEKIIKLAGMFPFVMGTKSGQPFELSDWQCFFLANVYGWRKKSNDLRRFRKAYLKTAKKNGKTEFAALIANVEMFLNKETLGQTFWAATKRDQARIGWDRQKLQLEILQGQSALFKKRFRLVYNKIEDNSTKSFSKALGRDSNKEDGIACKFGIIDEFHEHPNSDLLKQLETSSGNWGEPFFLIITTAGFNIEYPCAVFEYETCKPMLEGKLDYDSLFVMMFEIDVGDNWEDESCWYKANPNLGTHAGASPTLDFMRESYKTAINEGGEAITQFKTKNLNMWQNQRTTWVDDNEWQRRKKKIPFAALSAPNVRVFVGLDLASKRDLTAFVKLFLFPDGSYHIVPTFWIPEKRVKQLTGAMKVNFTKWIKEGYILVTSGSRIEFSEIEDHITAEHSIYNFEAIAYDPMFAVYLAVNLANKGLNMLEYRQIFSYMNLPMTTLEEDLYDDENTEKITHDGNPCMRWQVGNVVKLRNTTGLVRPSKENDKAKIDGVVGMIMAKGLQMDATHQAIDKTDELPKDWDLIIV